MEPEVQEEREREPEKEHVCIICSYPKQEGIMIVDEFICDDCEAEMVHTDVKDAKYPFFIMQMKQIWFRMNA